MARAQKSSPIFAVICLTLAIVGVLSAYVMYHGRQQALGRQDLQKKDFDTREAAGRSIIESSAHIASALSGEQEVSVDNVRKALEDARAALPQSRATNLFQLIQDYKLELERREKAKERAEQDKKDAEDRSAASERNADIQRETRTKEIDDLKAEREKLKDEFDKFRSDWDGRLKKLMSDTEGKLQERDKLLSEKNEEVNGYKDKIEKLQRQVDDLTAKLRPREAPTQDKGLLKGVNKPFKPETELADGRILEVDSQLRLAIIDLGRTHGIKKGMRFTVYRDSSSVPRHLKGRIIVREVLDLISKAYILMDRGQGQIFYLVGEFTDPPKGDLVAKLEKAGAKTANDLDERVNYVILGANPDDPTVKKARDLKVPIIPEHQVDSFLKSNEPIAAKDIIVNPVFSTLRRERFYLLGDSPNYVTPKHVIEARIREYGSEIATEIDTQTDYLVVGGKGAPEKADEIFKKANEAGVTIMREEELLAFLGD